MRNRIQDKHPAFFLGLALLGLVLCASLIARENVVSGNVWALGVPLAGMPADEAGQAVAARAREIERGPFTFVAGDLSCQVESHELRVALDDSHLRENIELYVASRPKALPVFVFRMGRQKVVAASSYLETPDAGLVLERIANALSREPLPGRYGFSGRELEILPPEQGQVVTPDDVRKALGSISGTVVEVSSEVISAPVSGEPEQLVLLGEFATPYDEKDADRNVNLRLAGAAVHGKVLEPDVTYSFNRTAGERTIAKGYRYANVVVGDHLEPGLAGGICQITTTLFNAAIRAGLNFPEVHAHGIPVDYVPPGCDSAVAWNYLDLKIRNNTGAAVVFGAWVENGQVTARVFGKMTGMTYEIDPVIVEEYPEEGKEPGLLVETYRVAKREGEVLERTLVMRSRYLPRVPLDK